ncbi:MAG: ACP phosphodiesterase [Gemmataceae bacterium]
MNWLAHALLSPDQPEVRLGNLLADLIKGRDRQQVSDLFRAGLVLHSFIDRFTDSHPLVHRSIGRLQGAYPLVGGILVDIFYDHLLTRRWQEYHPQTLACFVRSIYEDLARYAARLPDEANEAISWIIREDRLGSYARIEGIEIALRSVSHRLHARTGRCFHLEKALVSLLEQIDDYQADFDAFFPELRAATQSHWAAS